MHRFVNIDFASASGLQRWMDLLLHYSAYDINCQYRLYFEKRMKELWEMQEQIDAIKVIPEKPFPKTVAGVGKFHALGHNKDCRAKWGIGLQPGDNQVDGEAPERVWPFINALGNRMREMNPENRHNHMNAQYSNQNIRRVQKMHTCGLFLCHGVGLIKDTL